MDEISNGKIKKGGNNWNYVSFPVLCVSDNTEITYNRIKIFELWQIMAAPLPHLL